MSKSEARIHFFRFLPHAAVLAAITVFYGATLREGHGWGGDFAQYLHHAENLAEGRPYAETGYLYNPQNIIVGPRAYPPVFPAALAPAFALCNRNLYAVKIQLVLFFVATVAVTAWLFSRDLTAGQTLIYMALLGFSPALWQYKETILSEHLFLPLWYLAVLVADRWYRDRRVCISVTFHAVLLGFLIYLTYGTRSVGIVLLPAVFFCELLAARRLTRFGLVVMATAVGLILVQKQLLPESGQGYTEQLAQISLGTIKNNLVTNAVSIGNLWENGYSMVVATVVTAVTSVVAGVQFCRSNWPRPTFLGTAVLFYLVLITLWPSAVGLRLTLPLLPAVLFYVLLAMCNSSWPDGMQRRVLAGFCVFVTASYLAWYTAADYGPIEGVEDATAVELFDFIDSNTQEDEVCLFFKPRVLCFLARRPASAYPLVDNAPAFWDYVDSADAAVLIARKATDDFPETLVARHTDPRFVELWQNERFRVVRVAVDAKNVAPPISD